MAPGCNQTNWNNWTKVPRVALSIRTEAFNKVKFGQQEPKLNRLSA